MKEHMALKDIIEHAHQLSIEYTDSIFHFNPNWTGKRQAVYFSGPIQGMYEENDNMLMELMGDDPNLDRLKDLMVWCIKDVDDDIKKRMHHMELDGACSPGLYIIEGLDGKKYRYVCREHIDDVIRAKNLTELKDAVDNYNGHFLEIVRDEPIERQMMFLQIWLEYSKYQSYVKKASKFTIEQPELDLLYDSIFSKESEYKTYGLVPIDRSRELKVMTPPRIYDRELDKTLILALNKPVVEDISNLYIQNLVGKMAFRASGEIYEGLYTMQKLQEEVERGCLFNYNLGNLSDITKLYSKDYNDQLWIRKDGVNIYFEELDSEFETYEDYVITRLLHIEFEQRNEEENRPVVKHMDFEYIFYTWEDFNLRKINGRIKGSGKRKKIFKLDQCCIPIDYKVKMVAPDYSEIDVLFLISVLQAFFEHSDLINEYFSELYGDQL